MICRQSLPLQLKGPFWRLAEFFPQDECCFLLDSALENPRLGRHSFLGGKPAALLTGRRARAEDPWPPNWRKDHPQGGRPFALKLEKWVAADGRQLDVSEVRTWMGDPFVAMRDLQAAYGDASANPPGEGFTGGLVGYFGYEVAQACENLPDSGRKDPDLPDLAFLVADTVAALDHGTGAVTLTVTGRGPDRDTAADHAANLARTWQDFLEQPLPPPRSLASPGGSLQGDFNCESYSQAVEQCREFILRGDIFEVCLTQRLETEFQADPWALYSRLRAVNPAPFAAWLQFPGFQVLSASPERFLKLDDHRMAESRPIKGTRPRGESSESDLIFARELAASEKDRAENLMIVDLVRNDLGKVCETGSIEVPELFAVEEYATVFQLVSTVRGKLRPHQDALDLVQACYPGGSMTGAPKIQAMKIIDQLEPVDRGVFSGALGYLDRDGRMDLSIVIRTMICQGGKVHFGVGGAVTADSDPEAEYQETLDKARALAEALGVSLP